MKAVFLCLLVVGCAFASLETVQPSMSNSGFTLAEIQKINELRQTKWGNIFFTMAELQMTAGPIERLVQALDDLVKELGETQDAENERYAEKKATHEANAASLQQQINEANGEIANNKNQINAVLIPRKTSAQNTIARDQDLIVEKRNQIASATETRAREHASYEQRVADHNNAIAAVDECLNLLNSLLAGTPSMVELKKATLTIRRMEVKLKSTHFTETPLIEALISLVSDQNFTNQESLSQVLGLLNDFRAKLAKSLALENSNEAEAQANFDAQIVQLNKEITQLQQEIQESTQIINDSDKAIEECNNIIAQKNAEVLTLQSNLDAENEQWRKETETHEAVIAEIAKEIDVVKQCRALFANKQFGTFAASRMKL